PPTIEVTSSRLARASARNEPSDWCTTPGGVSWSCSSAISPTICSTISSIDTTPSAPPYSSTTSARWMRVVCIFASRSRTDIEGDTPLHADDIGARHHDVQHAALAQPENVLEHGAFGRRETGLAGPVLEHIAEVGAERA